MFNFFYSAVLTLAALGPFSLDSTSNVTLVPSAIVLKPSIINAE